MSVKEILNQARQQQQSFDNSRRGEFLLAVEVLLAYVLKTSKESFITDNNKELTDVEYKEFNLLISQYIEGKPVAYLMSHKEFFGLDFYVDNRVLIPRPETEHLVEKVLELAKKLVLEANVNSSLKIIDIGTGSGCIGLSIQHSLPDVQVTITDISPDALEVAALNAESLGLKEKIKIQQSNLLATIHEEFDIIVANLPYIGEEKFHFVSQNVYDYEPHVALFGGEDGLGLYRELFEQLRNKSWKPQYLLGEFGFLQAEELEKAVKIYFPEAKLEFFQDLAHLDRGFVLQFA